MPSIGERVKSTRKERHLSLAQLAQASGLSKGFLSQLESGTSKPSLASLDRIAVALGTSPLHLLSDADTTLSNPLLPATPRLVATERFTTTGANGAIDVVSAAEAGTHLLVDLPPGIELYSDAGKHAAVLATILEGSIFVSQSNTHLEISTGGIATWNSAEPYSISTSRNVTSRLLLFVPQSLTLPILRPLQVALASNHGTLGASSLSDRPTSKAVESSSGPLRLVAMRAQRLSERKGRA